MDVILNPPASMHAPLLQLRCEYAMHGGCNRHDGEMRLSSPSAGFEFIRAAPGRDVPRALSLLELHTRASTFGLQGRQSVDVACVLRKTFWKDQAFVLDLTSPNATQRVQAYVKNPKEMRLPVGLVPDARLLLTNAILPSSLDQGKLYLNLYATSGIHVALQPSAGPIHPGAESAMERVRQITIEQLCMRVHVPPGMHLCLTVLKLRQMSFLWRCHGCGQVKVALSCECKSAAPADGAGASFEEFCLADVVEGSGKAMLEVPGKLVWTLLQVSGSVVAQVQNIARRAGPLTVTMDPQTKDCLTLGGGDCRCAPDAVLRPAERLALAAAIPSADKSWNRVFVSVCRRTMTGRSKESDDRLRSFKDMIVDREKFKLLIMYGVPKLQALHMEACSNGGKVGTELDREFTEAEAV
jgi:hypothetical protein